MNLAGKVLVVTGSDGALVPLDTPKNRLDMPQADFSRWVTPIEAAEVIAFLVSDEARAVSGALIPVVGRV